MSSTHRAMNGRNEQPRDKGSSASPTQELSALSRAGIFEGIVQDDVEDLCSLGRRTSHAAGDRLFDRAEEARELMVLQSGVVELLFPIHIMGVTRELTIETKQVGDVVAWSALVAPYRSTLGARCAGECVLVNLEREVLETHFRNHSDVGYLFMRNLARVIGQRLQMMQTIWLHELQSSAMRQLE